MIKFLRTIGARASVLLIILQSLVITVLIILQSFYSYSTSLEPAYFFILNSYKPKICYKNDSDKLIKTGVTLFETKKNDNSHMYSRGNLDQSF